jgi:hypothetical protein
MEEILPANLELEKGLLCSCIKEPALLVEPSLEPDLLVYPANRALFMVLRGLACSLTQFDFPIVKHHCADLLEELGGAQSLSSLWEFVPSAANWRFYRDELALIKVRRELIIGAQKLIAELIHPEPGLALEDIVMRLGQLEGAISHNGARALSPHSSIVALAGEEIDSTLNLLGNRWLSRGTGAIICAPSGIGKSTLSIQAAALWACGKTAFGIHPVAPWRILIIQSEDDRNDMREMSRVLFEMMEAGLIKKDDLSLIDHNTHVERVGDLAGAAFVSQLDRWLKGSHFDMVFTNPLMSFVGSELSEQSNLTNFLRLQLGPVLEAHGTGAIVIHHTGKLLGEADKRREWWEYMYLLFGSSELTNWARAILFIKPTPDSGVFEFISAKRYEKIGWSERSYFFSHSSGGLLWVPSKAEVIEAARAARVAPKRAPTTYDALLGVLSAEEKLPRQAVLERAKVRLDKGRNWTLDALCELVRVGSLVRSEGYNPQGQPFVFYSLPSLE